MPNTVLDTIVDKISDATLTQLTVTTDTAENILVAAQTGFKIYVVAMSWCDTSATTITLKSGSNIIAAFELAANSGFIGALKVPLMTETSEALSLQTSAVGTFTIHYTTDQRLAYSLRAL